MSEKVQIRVHGSPNLPTLIYLPGLHGNWCLVGRFRRAIADRARFVEISYPSTINWSLEEHAAAVEAALAEHGVEQGWILGESFGSQVLWAIVHRNKFRIQGLVLAGGFVRHPFRWGARIAMKLCGDSFFTAIRWMLFGYAKLSRFRFRASPETYIEIRQFIDGLSKHDLQAAKHRLRLVAHSDFCSTARTARVPIYALSGLFDPVVPWIWVRGWMKKNCHALLEYKIIWHADHNVLGTAPETASQQVLKWLAQAA
jgi:pimeloyl-ACP methyl ester carboxylesterase